MDERAFDAWARALAGATSRRRTVRALAGGAVAALLTRLGGNEAAAGCAKVGRKCERSSDCCKGARCAGKRCRCKGERQACSGRCRDLRTDEANCGACGRVCPSSEPTCCRGSCVDTDTHTTHCGACENTCPIGQLCQPSEGCCTPTGGGCLPGNFQDCCHPDECQPVFGSPFGRCCIPSGAECDFDGDCCSGTCTIFTGGVVGVCE